MGYDPRSAAVIALCIAGVLVAAALFPAAGLADGPTSDDGIFGDTPVGAGPGDAIDTGGSDETANSGGESADSRGETNDPPGVPAEEPPDEPSSDEGATDVPRWLVLVFAVLALVIAMLVTGGVGTALGRPDEGQAGDGPPLPDGPLPRLRMRLARIPQLTMVATLSIARRATIAGDGVASLGRHLARTGLLAGESARTALRSLTTLSIGTMGVPRLQLPSIGWPTRSDRGRAGDRPRRSTGPDDPESAPDSPRAAEPASVEEAWRRLVASLPVRRPAVRTPRECAAIAIDAGYPPDAVETLTGTFEAVRYGDAAPTPARLDRVRAAYDRVNGTDGGDAS